MIMQVEHLSKSFGGRTLFSDVTFKLEEYDRLALVGPNGAGKTTMLNIISGREDADEGRILFAKGARVGYLEQEAIEMPDRPIFEEVMSSQVEILEAEQRLRRAGGVAGRQPHRARSLPQPAVRATPTRRWAATPSRPRSAACCSAWASRKATSGRPPANFSGGWQMRIALAKLLVRNPEVLLLDEPTNHLDLESR